MRKTEFSTINNSVKSKILHQQPSNNDSLDYDQESFILKAI